MEKTITLDGVEYLLVPKVAQRDEEQALLSAYSVGEGSSLNRTPPLPREAEKAPEGVEMAEGKQSEHRRKFLEQRLDPTDVQKGRGIPIHRIKPYTRAADSDVDSMSYKGDKLFFGEGLETG